MCWVLALRFSNVTEAFENRSENVSSDLLIYDFLGGDFLRFKKRLFDLSDNRLYVESAHAVQLFLGAVFDKVVVDPHPQQSAVHGEADVRHKFQHGTSKAALQNVVFDSDRERVFGKHLLQQSLVQWLCKPGVDDIAFDAKLGETRRRIEGKLYSESKADECNAFFTRLSFTNQFSLPDLDHFGWPRNIDSQPVPTRIANGDRSRLAIFIAKGTVSITNTIITSYAIGISNTAGTVAQNYNLFFANGADTQGTITNGSNTLSGDPAFANPSANDYHLTALSLAVDRGVDAGITTDFEAQPRPQALGFDIGFDESPFSAAILDLSAVNDSPTILSNPTTFTASITSGSNVTYTWSFGDDASTGTGMTVTHMYAAVGNYTAIVTATNGFSTTSASTVVTITTPPPKPIHRHAHQRQSNAS